MPFTPQEIEEKDFLITLRGYDKEEVKAFLKALAADYAELSHGAGEPGSADSYQAWGREMADLLQQANEAAERISRKASEEAGATRARAEDEAGRLREAARNAAARLKDEAEKHAEEVRAEAESYAREVRATAENDAGQRLADVNERVERLQATENEIRERLRSLEDVLGSVRTTLEPEGDAQIIDLSQQVAGGEQGGQQDAPVAAEGDRSPESGTIGGA